MKKLLFLLFMVGLSVQAQYLIPSNFYGQNFWYTSYTSAPSTAGTNLTAPEWELIKDSGAKLFRVGGSGYNVSSNKPNDPIGYVSIVDDIRQEGAEPMITVNYDPSDPDNDLNYYAKRAGQIVYTLNIVHKRNVKYFILANEPDKDYSWAHTTARAHDIADYIRAFAIEMRNADPDIKLIGPELKSNNSTVMDELLGVTGTGEYSIAGNIPASYNNESTGRAEGKPWIDYVSYHNYAGNGPGGTLNISTRPNYIDKGYDHSDANNYKVTGLPAHMKVIVDEFHVRKNEASSTTEESHYNGTDLAGIDYFDIETADPNSFLAGQFIVDMMAGMIKSEQVEVANIWSCEETSAYGVLHKVNNPSPTPDDFYRKPSYWHYWMMANYFKGTLYDNLNIPPGAYDPVSNEEKGLKGYACKSSDYIAVLVMNQHTAPQNYAIFLNGGGSAVGDLDFNVGLSGSSSAYSGNIPEKSTYLFFFSCNGTYAGRYELEQDNGTDGMADNLNYDLTQHFRNTSGTIITNVYGQLNPHADSYSVCLGLNTTGITNLGSGTVYQLPENIPVSNTSALSPGLYRVEYASSGSSCGTASSVFSVHENSPIIDAGGDKTVCTSTSSLPDLGNAAMLPEDGITLFYNWYGGASGTNFDREATISTAGTYTLNADDGCEIEDIARVISFSDEEVMVRDNYEDIGEEPNLTTTIGWRSPDIWSRRNTNDGVANQHAHIEPKSGMDNYIYYKIRNIGCDQITLHSNEIQLKWVQYTTGTPSSELDVLPGITSSSDVVIDPGEFAVVEFLWDELEVPNTSSSVHACFIARIVGNASDPEKTAMSGLAYTEGDNNQANRNVMIVGTSETGIAESGVGACIPVLVGNSKDTAAVLDFRIFENMDINPEFFKGGRMKINLGPSIYAAWVNGGMQGTGIRVADNKHLSASTKIHPHAEDNEYVIEVTSANATLNNIELDSNTFETIDVCYSFSNAIANEYFQFDIEQKTDSVVNGGVGFNITVPDCPVPNAGADTTIYRLCELTLNASPLISGAVYEWRDDRTGIVIDTGSSISVSPLVTTTYELQLRTPDGCIDYDLVKVTVDADSAYCGPTCGVPDYDNYTLPSSLTLSNDTVVIKNFLKIGSGKVLTIQNCYLIFDSNSGIRAQPGGKLILENSTLLACDRGKKWRGIQAKGNGTVDPLTITGCTFVDAIAPVYVETAENVLVSQNIFADGQKGIEMKECYNFTIEQNQFYLYDTVIYAYNNTLTDPALIKRNYLIAENKGIVLSNGSFDSLQILCNVFASYIQYGIYSSNCTLGDQGSSSEGAGNVFITSSVLTNHQFRHDGNAMTYYYNPKDTVSLTTDTTYFATSSAALADGTCTQIGNFREAQEMLQQSMPAAPARESDYLLNSIPNPATEHVKIVYELPEDMRTAQIRIFNVLGEQVRSYSVERGSTSKEFDCSAMNNGVYFYSLIVNEKLVKTKKMIISK